MSFSAIIFQVVGRDMRERKHEIWKNQEEHFPKIIIRK